MTKNYREISQSVAEQLGHTEDVDVELTLAHADAAEAEDKLAGIRAELHELVADTRRELDAAVFLLTGAQRKRSETPEALTRMVMLAERLNVLDEVQRIVGF